MSVNNPQLWVCGDIHGDLGALFLLVEKVMKVARLKKDKTWEWISPYTTVVVLGDFLDRFRPVENGTTCAPFTNAFAMKEEMLIVDHFRKLMDAAQKAKESKFMVLVGNHELGNLWDLPEFYPFQVANPENRRQVEERQLFVKKHIIPFLQECYICVAWGPYIMCHGSMEYEWFKTYEKRFKTIPELNRWFKNRLKHKDYKTLYKVLNEHSPCWSRKMAEHTELWRMEDKPYLIKHLDLDRLGNEKNKKVFDNNYFIVGHTPTPVLKETSMQFLNQPTCRCIDDTLFLASKDGTGADDAFFVDVGMSSAFDQSFHNVDMAQRRPQALQFSLQFSNTGDLNYTDCKGAMVPLTTFNEIVEEYKRNACPQPPDKLYHPLDEDVKEYKEKRKETRHRLKLSVYPRVEFSNNYVPTAATCGGVFTLMFFWSINEWRVILIQENNGEWGAPGGGTSDKDRKKPLLVERSEWEEETHIVPMPSNTLLGTLSFKMPRANEYESVCFFIRQTTSDKVQGYINQRTYAVPPAPPHKQDLPEWNETRSLKDFSWKDLKMMANFVGPVQLRTILGVLVYHRFHVIEEWLKKSK